MTSQHDSTIGGVQPRGPGLRLLGLPPIVSPDTRLLILGSFPGAASLARHQYYAHPQNHFWKILQAIWPDSPRAISVESYEKRSEWLLGKGLGVWDVYASCEREGSLDAAIRNAQVNDFARLQRMCPQLSVIAHNGGESFRHARHVLASLSAAGAQAPLPVYKLPSTSPANASWSFERKLAAWREAMAAAGLL
ncbi:DNA-deoxyinosine glycosylase [Rhodoferax sp.]|uniref:DNA-deoxyinosine glycosylase n=1 Tax=Rhodoferax sp. TaxID=50421 RepID=UPI001EB5816B|nr:DNA-deoxyinosine glycosylase [Rhodoferax sp.]MBT9506156.1 DNA-deoxyinosine glycosylase [Rhodoferax sp.]